MIQAGAYYAILNDSIRTCEHIKTGSASSALTMSVYPNPVVTNHEITVDIDNADAGELSDAKLQLHSIDGRLLKTQPVTGAQTKITVPANSGIVVVKLITGSGNQEVKVIVK